MGASYIDYKLASGMNLQKAVEIFERVLDEKGGTGPRPRPVDYLRSMLGLPPKAESKPKGDGGKAEEPKSEPKREAPKSKALAINVPEGAEMLPDNAQWTNRMQIKSESSGRLYTIAQNKSGRFWGCNCPGWIGHKKCKHLQALGLPGYYKPFEALLKQGSAGDCRPEEVPFDFGAGDLADIVLTEDENESK